MRNRPLHHAAAMLGRLCARLCRRLAGDESGNILMMTGIAIVPLTMAIGFGVDYARAEKLQTKLNAAADAAALAAVDPTMIGMANTNTACVVTNNGALQQAVLAIFNQQASGLAGLTNLNPQLKICDAISSGSLGTQRTAVVTYTADSTNSFGALLGMASLHISGSSTANAAQPPSINFYVALDTSPSMLLPTSTTGIANLNAGARWNGEYAIYSGYTDGCDFACHADNMQTWNYGVFVIDANKYAIYLNNAVGTPDTTAFYRVSCSGTVYDSAGNVLGASGSVNSSNYCTSASSLRSYPPASNPITLTYTKTGAKTTTKVSVSFPDTYWLAENYSTVNPGGGSITLRTDAETFAAANLVNYAYTIQKNYASSTVPPKYGLVYYTFNVGTPQLLSSSAPFNGMANVADLNTYLATNSFPSTTSAVPSLAQVTCGSSNTWNWPGASPATCNADTNFTTMLTYMQNNLPTNAGTGASSSSPQTVLVIVTDGAEDDNTGDGMTQLNSNNISQCAKIKALPNTRIAILYTQYLPATINYTKNTTFNNFANNNVPYIQQQLQKCASQNPDGSYLMQTVSTDGDVSQALNTLFAMAVASARLVQ